MKLKKTYWREIPEQFPRDRMRRYWGMKETRLRKSRILLKVSASWTQVKSKAAVEQTTLTV
jgi:hypothetical protein